MSLTEEQEKEIRKLCFFWIAKHDDLMGSRKYGGASSRLLECDKKELIERSRDIRDAIAEAGI